MNQLAKDPELEEIIIPDYTNPFSATVKVAIEVLAGEIGELSRKYTTSNLSF